MYCSQRDIESESGRLPHLAGSALSTQGYSGKGLDRVQRLTHSMNDDYHELKFDFILAGPWIKIPQPPVPITLGVPVPHPRQASQGKT